VGLDEGPVGVGLLPEDEPIGGVTPPLDGILFAEFGTVALMVAPYLKNY